MAKTRWHTHRNFKHTQMQRQVGTRHGEYSPSLDLSDYSIKGGEILQPKPKVGDATIRPRE
jgi:hypothetical protein